MNPREIYRILRDKVIWLDLEPESTLNLAHLAESLHVSRTPITIALTRLEAEGWVVRHGSLFVVSPLSLSRIKEISEIRYLLEVRSTIWAMERMTSEELTSLLELRDEILVQSSRPFTRKMIELDFTFHQRMFAAMRNSELSRILEHLLSQYLRFWLSASREISSEAFFQEALEIIAAVQARNEKEAREATMRHISRSVEEILGSDGALQNGSWTQRQRQLLSVAG